MTDRPASMPLDVPAAFRGARRSIIRLEQQALYAVDLDGDDHYQRWLDRDPIEPIARRPFRDWLKLCEETTARGVAITRVRIHEDPPTEAQAWARWKGRWNTAAGDTMRYLSRPTLGQRWIGDTDWWLIDDSLLLVQEYDAATGRLVDDWATIDLNEIQPRLELWRHVLAASEPGEDLAVDPAGSAVAD